jgi:hypothetical protein
MEVFENNLNFGIRKELQPLFVFLKHLEIPFRKESNFYKNNKNIS